MTEVKHRFRWYWLGQFEASTGILVLGTCAIILLPIPPRDKIICMIVFSLGYSVLNRYLVRLRERLGSDWVDPPRSWKVFWWLFTIIVLLAATFFGNRGLGIGGE